MAKNEDSILQKIILNNPRPKVVDLSIFKVVNYFLK